jgi:hypothetical protein
MGGARGKAGKQPGKIGGDGGARAEPPDFVAEERAIVGLAGALAKRVGLVRAHDRRDRGGRWRQTILIAIPGEIFAKPRVRAAKPMHRNQNHRQMVGEKDGKFGAERAAFGKQPFELRRAISGAAVFGLER